MPIWEATTAKASGAQANVAIAILLIIIAAIAAIAVIADIRVIVLIFSSLGQCLNRHVYVLVQGLP